VHRGDSESADEVADPVRPVDDTVRLRPDGDDTARLEPGGDDTVRLEPGVDDTVRLQPDRASAGPSAPPQRPAQRAATAPSQTVRASGPRGGVGGLVGPLDDTVRLQPGRASAVPSAAPQRPAQRAATAASQTVRAGGRGDAMARHPGSVDPTARPPLGRQQVNVPMPPRRPRGPNVAPARNAVPVCKASPWRRRVRRTALPVGAVLVFIALVVFSGQLFGGDERLAQTKSVPSTEQGHPASEHGSPAVSPDRSSARPDGLLPPAQGVQAFSGDTGQQAQPTPSEGENRPTSWWQLLANGGLVVLSLALFTISSTTLWWMLHAWRSPDALAATGFRRRAAYACRSFSLLLPARHKQDVLGDTIDALARLDHPKYEVIVIIGHDDPETESVARRAAARHPRIVRVVIDHNVPKNKPKALNTALPRCRGDIVGVFDAEDEVHPGLLRLIEARFEESGADVVQAGVQLMNVQTSWWSLRNCLEYYFWFRSRLHFHADQRFIPLGGNTVFTRTELLRQVGGWDPDCLAEDCEIGVRLSTRGATVAVAYDPQVVTREETPGSIRALVKQRTRWDQGFLQVLRKGEWRKLPSRRQRWLARYTLAMPFLQAATGVLLPLSLVSMFLLKLPVPTALVTFLPLAPTFVTMAVESAALGEFGQEFGIRIRWRDHARLLLGSFPYQVLLAAAALRSVWRQCRGQGGWEKTAHANAHRTATPKKSVAV
jgi:glycosyltransferase XagB